MKKHTRGATLKTVVITSFILLGLVATMSLVSRKDLFLAVDTDLAVEARLAGDSIVKKAIVLFKRGDLTLDRRLEYNLPPEDLVGKSITPEGFIHFDKEQEYYSTNNLNSGSSVEGWNGTLVPKRSVHLVGVGRAGTMQHVNEVILGLPRYPFSVAANGTIEGTDLDIFALDSLEALDGGVQDSEKKKGNVISNHEGPGHGVVLGPNTTVTGDVTCASTISLTGNAEVLGEQKPDSEKQNLAELDLNRYDPNNGSIPPAIYSSSMVKISEGKARHTGNLNLGDLELDQGLLFVEGDLEISGHVAGSGAIVATGNITVTGQLNLESDFVALVSGGDVTIDGTDKGDLTDPSATGTRMQGLVYANGAFTAEDATLVGAIVSSKINGSTKLDRVNMAHTPEASRFEITVDAELRNVVEPGPAERNGYNVYVELPDGTTSIFDELNTTELQAVSDSLAQGSSNERGRVFLARGGIEVSASSVAPNIRVALSEKAGYWVDYVDAVKANTVARETIFSIDLNSFLSIEENLEILHWKSGRRPR